MRLGGHLDSFVTELPSGYKVTPKGTIATESTEEDSLTADTPATRPRGRPAKVAVTDIADAAVELFGRQGLHGVSISTIAQSVGLTDGGLLHHFPTRGALLDAALARSVDRQVERVRELVAPGGLPALRALGVWGSVMEETPELTAFSALASADAARPESPLREWEQRRYAAVVGLIASLVSEGMERGEIRKDADPAWEATGLIAFVDGVRLQWLLADGDFDLPGAIRRHVNELASRLAA